MGMEFDRNKKQEVATQIPEKLSNNDYGKTDITKLEQAKRPPMGSDGGGDKKVPELKEASLPTDFRSAGLQERRPDVNKLKEKKE